MKRFFYLLPLFLWSTLAWAQPANDDCVDAISVTVATDESSCSSVTATTVDGTGSTTPTYVCSGTWFEDDIWFSFDIGDDIPANGVVVKAYFGGAGEVEAVGMGIYPDCGADAIPFYCLSTDDSSFDEVRIYPASLSPNSTHYIRVWSGLSPSDNSGEVSICVFEAEPIMDEDIVVWGNNPGEGDFDGGLNDWTVVPISDPTHVWEWSPTASTFEEFTTSILYSVTAGNGAMLMNAEYYNTVNGAPSGPPYPKITSELISPTIDLSDVADAQVRFTQSFRGLNGNDAGTTARGALLSFSTDDGATWSEPEAVNDDIAINDYSNNPDTRRVTISGAGGSSAVKIKFIFDGDFYFWLLDDVKIIERVPHSTAIFDNRHVVAENYATPISQVAPVLLGSYATNLGGAAQTNVTVSVATDYYDNDGTLITEDAYMSSGLIEILDIDKDSIILISEADGFVPEQVGFYMNEYTLSQDSTEAYPDDNTATSWFRVTDNVFSKAPLDSSGLPLVSSSSSPAEGTEFEYGIHIYMPNGNGHTMDNVIFAYDGGTDGLSGEAVDILLRIWEDANNDALISDDELTIIAYNSHDFTDEENNQFIVLSLLDFQTDEPSIPLEDNTHYILTGDYRGSKDIRMTNYSGINYDAMTDASLQRAIAADDSNLMRFGDILRLGTVWYRYGFNGTGVPAVAVTISGMDVANETVDTPEIGLEIYPNPTEKLLSISLKNTQNADRWKVQVTDVTGRHTILNAQLTQAGFPLHMNVEKLPVGTYILTLESENQIISERFIKK